MEIEAPTDHRHSRVKGVGLIRCSASAAGPFPLGLRQSVTGGRARYLIGRLLGFFFVRMI